eukprot:365379-Chlamydomonas_euryale.AAC.2
MHPPSAAQIRIPPLPHKYAIRSYVRKHAMSFAGRTVGMPVAGKIAVLLYRRDVFTGAGLASDPVYHKSSSQSAASDEAVATRALRRRDDVVEAARILNGTDMDGDGEGDFSMCLQLTDSNSCPVQVHTAGQVCGRFCVKLHGCCQVRWRFCVDCMATAVLLP